MRGLIVGRVVAGDLLKMLRMMIIMMTFMVMIMTVMMINYVLRPVEVGVRLAPRLPHVHEVVVGPSITNWRSKNCFKTKKDWSKHRLLIYF